jgi:hypothetical protein
MTGKIPQSDIDRARYDIVSVVSARIDLKKTGKNLSACCPFHKEKSPSFSVSEDKGFYYCFGCGASGDAIEFVMAYDSVDFRQAVASINGDLPSTVTQSKARREWPTNLVAAARAVFTSLGDDAPKIIMGECKPMEEVDSGILAELLMAISDIPRDGEPGEVVDDGQMDMLANG